MKEIINQYKFEADRLADHIAGLRKTLDAESDPDIAFNLKKRIRLLEIERYEILRDISDMINGQSFAGKRLF